MMVKLLVNDGEMVVIEGEISVWIIYSFTIIDEHFTIINEHCTIASKLFTIISLK